MPRLYAPQFGGHHVSDEYLMPKRMRSYLRRIEKEYRANDNVGIADVIAGSAFKVFEHFDQDNNGAIGHKLELYVPDHLISNIPIDQQSDIQNELRKSINQASLSVPDEYMDTVAFDYVDDLEQIPQDARKLEASQKPLEAPPFWLPDTVKLFISHRDSKKKTAHALASALAPYGISCFVAHDTIEPDEDWQKEIEKALQTMDAMLALICDGFFDSAWTNQEIGFAIARNVPVISMKIGAKDPFGFIRNRQAISADPANISYNAEMIVDVVRKRMPKSDIIRKAMIETFCNSGSFSAAKTNFDRIASLSDLSTTEVEKLIESYNSNSQINGSWALNSGKVLSFVNAATKDAYLTSNGKIIPKKRSKKKSDDDEIPF